MSKNGYGSSGTPHLFLFVHVRAQQEVQRFTAALAALGSSSSNGHRTFRRRSSAYQPRAKKAMGESSEWFEANSGNCFGSCETHTKNLSRRQKENRGRCTCTLGEVQGGEEEGCLELW